MSPVKIIYKIGICKKWIKWIYCSVCNYLTYYLHTIINNSLHGSRHNSKNRKVYLHKRDLNMK